MRIAVPPGPALPVLASLLLGIVWQSIVRTPEPESDALLYDWLASALSGHGEPGQDVRYAVDGMAIRGWTQASLMAATYVVAGPEPAAYAWLQAVVLLPATTLLVYVAGRFAFGRAVGLVAAWGFALWFPLVYYTTWVMPETTIGLVAAGSSHSLRSRWGGRASRRRSASVSSSACFVDALGLAVRRPLHPRRARRPPARVRPVEHEQVDGERDEGEEAGELPGRVRQRSTPRTTPRPSAAGTLALPTVTARSARTPPRRDRSSSPA